MVREEPPMPCPTLLTDGPSLRAAASQPRSTRGAAPVHVARIRVQSYLQPIIIIINVIATIIIDMIAIIIIISIRNLSTSPGSALAKPRWTYHGLTKTASKKFRGLNI